MRIGILTLHWAYNFGANLQALSTSTLLAEMGHDVRLLNYRPQDLEALYRERVPPEQVEIHEHFYASHFRQSPVCRTEADLIDYCQKEGFDVILVGSDAVFRLSRRLDRLDTRFPNPFWLTWVASGLRPKPFTAALAASSMGTNFLALPFGTRRGIGQAVTDMGLVSVRDRWTQLMLLALSWGRCRPSLCPDPVVVLNDVFQLSDSDSKQPAAHHRDYILLSVYRGTVSDAWIQDLVNIAHRQGLQVFSFPHPEGAPSIPVDYEIPLPLSPLTWYAWLQHAAGYIGVRFHPIVCSMINGVPFVSFDTYQRSRLRFSSKTYDLCARANMSALCLSRRERRTLTPETTLQLLAAAEQEQSADFVIQAKRTFLGYVDRVLAQGSQLTDAKE